jgi:aryl-alcohol dehydrogenase-like predicted oxidoreductase
MLPPWRRCWNSLTISAMKLGLGTVQFGMDYGVTNQDGRVPEDEVGRILALAAMAGISVLDTAQAYGESEAVLGRQMPPDHGFRIVTKTAPLSTTTPTGAAAEIRAAFEDSLQRLKQVSVHALLVHDCAALFGPAGTALWAEMEKLRDQGLVQKIGASVYNAGEIEALLDSFNLDIIQLPINLLDQKLQTGGQLKRLHRRGIEVHARSIFLQGILLAPPDRLDRRFDGLRGHLTSVHKYLSDHGLSPLQGAIAYPLQRPEIDMVLVGVSGEAELRDILAAMDSAAKAEMDPAPCACDDDLYLNPSRWASLPAGNVKRDCHC